MGDAELTPIQQSAFQRIEEIDEKLDALNDAFDYQAACDPNVDSGEVDMLLFDAYERLLMERSQLQDVVDGQAEPWVSENDSIDC